MVGGLLSACLVGLVGVSIYVLPDQLVTHDVGITAVERLTPAELLTVSAENLIHVMRPGGIR